MSDNFFGSGSAAAVSTRPSLTPAVARAGSPTLWFKPCSSAGAGDGTPITAETLNLFVANLDAVRVAAGIDAGDVTPGGDDTLLAAIRALMAAGYLAKAGDTATGSMVFPDGVWTESLSRSAASTLAATDVGKCVILNDATSYTTTLPPAEPGGILVLHNNSAVAKTLAHTSMVYGLAALTSITLTGGQTIAFFGDGTSWHVHGGSWGIDTAIAAAKPAVVLSAVASGAISVSNGVDTTIANLTGSSTSDITLAAASLTIVDTGPYAIDVAVEGTVTTTAATQVWVSTSIYVNGTRISRDGDSAPLGAAGTSGALYSSAGMMLQLAAGDVVTIKAQAGANSGFSSASISSVAVEAVRLS